VRTGGHFAELVRGALRVADLALIALAGLAAWALHLAGRPDAAPPAYYAAATGLALLLSANVFHLLQVYRIGPQRRQFHRIGQLLLGWTLVLALLIAAAFFTKTSEAFSRLWVLIWFGGAFGLMAGLRLLLALVVEPRLPQDWRQLGVVVVGCPDRAQGVIERLRDAGEALAVRGFFHDAEAFHAGAVAGIPVLGGLDAVEAYCRGGGVDRIVLALPWSDEERLRLALRRLYAVPVDVHVAGTGAALAFTHHGLSHLAGVPMLHALNRPFAGWGRVLKAAEDKALAGAMLVAAAPLMLLIAALVRLDSPGPVLFRQVRLGFNRQPFAVFKFRTLYHHLSDAHGETLVGRNDARVTRVGRWLRRWSLDELPQLLNVLRGEMSVVGPRPHALKAAAGGHLYTELFDEYALRYRVRPGITGWAQVNGLRGDTSTVELLRRRLDHDVFYIENWSIWLDLKILFLTLVRVPFDRQAV